MPLQSVNNKIHAAFLNQGLLIKSLERAFIGNLLEKSAVLLK